MQTNDKVNIIAESKMIYSKYLAREVQIDIYQAFLQKVIDVELLLINDGQDLKKMDFASLLTSICDKAELKPLICVGIYAGSDRLHEYATEGILDFAGRGVKAQVYQQFITQELIPFVQSYFRNKNFIGIGIAGFSMGGLSAVDTALNHPGIFQLVAAFSGSFWWRRKDLNDGYDEAVDRIMHSKIRVAANVAALKFYFTTGSLDETSDRNNNGVIDSIDDTLDLIREIQLKGCDDIKYINYENGKHDLETWKNSLGIFLLDYYKQ